MKRKIFFLVCLFMSFCVFAKNNDIDSVLKTISEEVIEPLQQNSILCILEFTSTQKEVSEYIQSTLISYGTETNKVKIVTRNNMEKIDQELRYQSSGYVSESTALSICERLGANSIVFGEIKELANKYYIEVKMLDVETGTYLLYRTYEFSRSSKSEQLFGRAANYCKTSLGIILEGNKNSLESISPAAGLYVDYILFRKLGLGIKALVSYDLNESLKDRNEIYATEILGLARYYLVSPSGEPSTGLFIEGDFGIELVFVNQIMSYGYSIGGGVGFRKEIGTFYLEPELRCGYPYIFGIDLVCGIRL